VCPFGQHGSLLRRPVKLDVVHTGISLAALHTALALFLAIVGSSGSRIELSDLFRCWKWIWDVFVAKDQCRHRPLFQPFVAQAPILEVHLTDSVVKKFTAIRNGPL